MMVFRQKILIYNENEHFSCELIIYNFYLNTCFYINMFEKYQL